MGFDVDKLVKVLAMTTSPNDHEALAAMRKANAMLKDQGLTWSEFVRLHTPYYQNAKPEPRYTYTGPRSWDHQYTRPERYGFYWEDIERQAAGERQRQRGEAARAERERRQAERDQYKPGEQRNPFDDIDDMWAKEQAKDEIRQTDEMRMAGLDEKSIDNYAIFHAMHPDIATWLWKHRDDDPITKMSWRGVVSYPTRLGPLHFSILRTMMRHRT